MCAEALVHRRARFDRSRRSAHHQEIDVTSTVNSDPTTQLDDDDFRDILAHTRTFVRNAVLPREQEIDEADAIPADVRAAAKDMGLFGFAIPQEWGGLGMNLAQDVELAMELGYTTLALRSMFGTNNGIAGQVLVNY
ncbi:acyl-CoA dehydrogenase, partial [Rhodococcus wratislaviensis IFP 2016]